MTEREHLDRAEVLAQRAENAITTSTQAEMGTEPAYRKAEVLARLAEMHYLAAAVHSLTADVPGSPRPADRGSGLPSLTVTKMRERTR